MLNRIPAVPYIEGGGRGGYRGGVHFVDAHVIVRIEGRCVRYAGDHALKGCLKARHHGVRVRAGVFAVEGYVPYVVEVEQVERAARDRRRNDVAAVHRSVLRGDEVPEGRASVGDRTVVSP